MRPDELGVLNALLTSALTVLAGVVAYLSGEVMGRSLAERCGFTIRVSKESPVGATLLRGV
jgi:hypothetical protein